MPEAQSKFSIKVFVVFNSKFVFHAARCRPPPTSAPMVVQQVAVRVRPLLGHDRKQEVCVSASGGENGERCLATLTNMGGERVAAPTPRDGK